MERVALSVAHRLLAARPTCLLTTAYKGQVNVMSIAWVQPVSMEPPLVGMAIHPSSYTHDMLKRSEECVLNIPSRPMLEQVLKCGRVSGADVDKVREANLVLESAQRVSAPWIEGCLAYLECAVVEVVAPGDHSLFIAEIVDAWAEEAAFQERWLIPEEEELLPLHHLGGSVFALLGKLVQPRP